MERLFEVCDVVNVDDKQQNKDRTIEGRVYPKGWVQIFSESIFVSDL